MASSFFSPKSAGTRFLTGLCNLIIVNFLFVLTCIPVFTIGASLTALYRITIAILAGDNPAVFKDYFKAFKSNFLKATGLQFFYMALFAFFIFEIVMVRTMLTEQYQWSAYPAMILLIIIFAASCYSFPILAWFDESFKQLLKNSLLIAVTNLPVTVMYIVFSGLLAYLVYQFPTTVLSIMVFMGCSTLAIFYSLFLKRIFEKHGAKISFKEEDDDKPAIDDKPISSEEISSEKK